MLLRGKDLELQIAFDGENAAFDQFRDALIVPDTGVEAGAEGEAGAGEDEDEDVAGKSGDQTSSHEEADCGLTGSPSSGSPSGSSSERVDMELDDEYSVVSERESEGLGARQ